MELWERQSLFTKNVAKLINYINDQGYTCTLGEVYRTPEQAALNAKTGKGIKNSLHCDRLAVDINLFTKDGQYQAKTEQYKPFGDYWEKLNQFNKWGGSFPRGDGNHFESSLGK